MSGDVQTLDEIVLKLDEQSANAVREGILDRGHYDSEPSPDDVPAGDVPIRRRPDHLRSVRAPPLWHGGCE